MSLRKVFFFIYLVVLVLCLAAGYGFAGQWIGAVFAVIMAPVWLLARKYPNAWLPHICLLISISLAAIGRVTGAPSLLMIFGAGAALAVWDLFFLDNSLGSNSSGEQTLQYEKKHLQSLALATGFGLSVAFLGHFINLKVPFIVLALSVVLSLFGLDRVWVYIKNLK